MQSLIWPGDDAVPGGGPRPGVPPAPHDLGVIDDQAARDIELDPIVDWLMQDHPNRRAYARHLLTHPPLSADVVRWRSAVMRDLLASPHLCDALAAAAAELGEVARHQPERFPKEVARAARIGARVTELRAFLRVLHLLDDALAAEQVQAPALAALRLEVRQALDVPEVAALDAELPALSSALAAVRSVTLGINVGAAMEPEGAVILGFSSRAATLDDTALLRFTRVQGQTQSQRGLARLFRHTPVNWQGDGRMASDVQALLEAVATPIEHALHSFRVIQTQSMLHLEDELLTLVGAARMAREWRAAGLPCCTATLGGPQARPEGMTDPSEQWVAIDAFHPTLARQIPAGSSLTLNRIDFGDSGTVWILTGPNRGGKTTYLRAAAMVQVLGQSGLPVPARTAALRLARRVFTHFPAPEAGVAGQGRLDEEAERMRHIFAECGASDMVLLNEVLAGTSAPEGTVLAADILRGLRVAGCNVIYATHLHDLARRAAELNASIDGPSSIRSLTVQTAADEAQGSLVRRPTYRVVPGEPEGASFFASQIAQRHGVSLPQIIALLQSRNARRVDAGAETASDDK